MLTNRLGTKAQSYMLYSHESTHCSLGYQNRAYQYCILHLERLHLAAQVVPAQLQEICGSCQPPVPLNAPSDPSSSDIASIITTVGIITLCHDCPGLLRET